MASKLGSLTGRSSVRSIDQSGEPFLNNYPITFVFAEVVLDRTEQRPVDQSRKPLCTSIQPRRLVVFTVSFFSPPLSCMGLSFLPFPSAPLTFFDAPHSSRENRWCVIFQTIQRPTTNASMILTG